MRAKRLYGGPRVCTDRTENVCIGPCGGAPPGTEVIYLAETNHTPQSPGPGRRRRKRPAGAEIALNILKVLGTLLLIVLPPRHPGCFAAVYIKTVIMPQGAAGPDQVFRGPVHHHLLHGSEYRRGRGVADRPRGREPQMGVLCGYPGKPVMRRWPSEDKRFYDHHGVDWLRTARGVLTMVHRRRYPGAAPPSPNSSSKM